MGVQNLWELLAPVGRRVSVETLSGKRLAIDASIWMIQFMKAMRDEKGEMVRNAHILGFFRRICKLLFLRTKPVFVFDGGTPALKRRTVVARRRQRENAQAKIRKTAEKLLLNHLKAMRLKDLADNLENQRQENGGKGKKVVMDDTGNSEVGNEKLSQSYNQEAIDEMVAASLAAEGDGGFIGDASTSGAGILAEDEDEDEDEEMILPNLHGKIDPAVLAALPPSMQLDLLVQMRERLMAENRQKYQKVKKAPARFSELQIQAYLKTVAFRREISEVQKSAGGRGISGVQTSRIASEANREFIFSSSFTGDRQVLASAGVEGNSNERSHTPNKHSFVDSVVGGSSTKKLNAETLSAMDEPRKSAIHEDVETYLDERGRVRVSKVRSMGIRMTRDLQRNLDLMKEIEQQREDPKSIANDKSNIDSAAIGISRRLSEESNLPEASYQSGNRTLGSNRRNEETIPISGTSIEVSFEEDNEQKCADTYDDLFAQIVAGDSVISVSTDNKKQLSDSNSDCEWEDGAIEDLKGQNIPPPTGGSISDESEVEWEEDSADIPEQNFLCQTECRNTDSKGALEEEADFQEAIRRSIEDLQSQKDIHASSESEKLKDARKASEFTSVGSLYLKEDKADSRLPLENALQSNESSVKVVSGDVGRLETVGEVDILTGDDPPPTRLAALNADKDCDMEVKIDKPRQSHLTFHPELSSKDGSSGEGNSPREHGQIEPIIHTEEKGADLSKDVLMNSPSEDGEALICTKLGSGVDSFTSDSLTVDMPDVTHADAQQSEFGAAIDEESKQLPESEHFLAKEASGINVVQRFVEKVDTNVVSEERVVASDISYSKDRSKEEVEITGARLQEEMLNLTKERIDLGDEQRKNERNAESVSGEMFAECQELLQMFGLPYIIAPMEAEAQCAYMELENLVDGVVTDDSDVLLFGARSVYKNIFDDRKYVETYFMKDIENELGLTREKLIRMALLLGSDYTEGVSGIGIVNAVEVLTAFPEEDGLRKFREWIESPDPSILGQAGSTPRKKGSKRDAEGVSGPNQSGDDIEKTKQIFMDKHRNVSKNWHIPSSFPSEAVVSAYASPQVDKSTEPFAWGKPDLSILRKLCWEKFGWSTQKADELLQPVLKEYNKHETQLRLEAFYTFNERFAKIRSKRISKAVKGIAGSKSAELVDEPEIDAPKVRKKRKVSLKEDKDDKEKNASRSTDDVASLDDTNSVDTSAGKHTRKRLILEESSEVAKSKPPLEEKPNTKKGSSVRGRGTRGRRGRGRGRDQSVGRGRRKENSLGFVGSSSDDGSSSINEQERLAEQFEGSHEVRRSKRARKVVKYTINDFENSGKTNQDDESSAYEEAKDEESLKDADTSVDADDVVDFSGSKDHETKDPINEKDLLWNTLETGGGFCMDEAELELCPLNSGQNDKTLPMTESSKEYLQMGGGFCLDDDEDDNNDPGNASCPMQTQSFEDPNPLHDSGIMEEAENDIGPSQLVHGGVNESNGFQTGEKINAFVSSQNACSADVVEEDASETRPVRLLSAMPNLRRKRRKS